MSKTRSIFLSLIILCIATIEAYAQNNSFKSGSIYFQDYSNKLILRIYTVTKSNSLTIEDPSTGKSLELLPNAKTNFGLGLNYKKFGLGLAFGFPSSSERNEKFGKTQRLDLQASLYGSKFGGDGFLQLYKGYYNSNPQDFVEWDKNHFPQIPSMRILSIGLSSFYLFNSKKYSYRAAFVRDEIQKKSAGSLLLGIFANYDEATTESGFIPPELSDSIAVQFDLKEFTTFAVGVTVGYAYNFVIGKKFIFGLAAIPGFGYQHITITNIDMSGGREDQPAGQLLTKTAFGYEHKHFYLGLTGSVNFRNLNFKPYNFNLATGQFKFIVGKRFSNN